MGQRFAGIPDIQRKVTMLLRSNLENNFQDCFWQCTTVSWSAQLHNESIWKVTAATSAQVSKFCFQRAILGIKLSYLMYHKIPLIFNQCAYIMFRK
jgi:hypothetical protein